MDVRLNPHSEELLKEQLARGPYHSPEEVIERALETLTEREWDHPCPHFGSKRFRPLFRNHRTASEAES
jgi:hypothetical protein